MDCRLSCLTRHMMQYGLHRPCWETCSRNFIFSLPPTKPLHCRRYLRWWCAPCCRMRRRFMFVLGYWAAGRPICANLSGPLLAQTDGSAKASYPTTSEEAIKVLFSLLLTSPAVIEFDDMNADWIPDGSIKRALTAESVAEQILGVSKTATVSTRTLFLGSGSNVGPVRNLLLLLRPDGRRKFFSQPSHRNDLAG